MAFDLENAVQQGFNRDVTNNDWHVEARNLEIKLEDAAGTYEFRLLDSDNTAVLVSDSDGYLAAAGNVEVHGGNILVESQSASGTNSAFVTLKDTADQASLYLFDENPDGTISGQKGSFGTSYADGYMYINVNGGTKWERMPYTSQISSPELDTTTLQRAYDNDPDGGNAGIVTNATDGAIVISGTQKLQVTATGGLDLDSGFDMDGAGPFDINITGAVSIDTDAASDFTVDGANLTLRTINSGDVLVSIPNGTGDFIVDDAGGSRYLRAITSNGELQLGDPDVFTTVMDDLRVVGDLVVQGTTTTVATQELLVEDRLIRLNAGATDSAFSGNVGIEAEVGSDGYVEFHWDDTSSRWEVSIDRNTTPEAQTFRPLGYLADDAATLDLSSLGTDGYHGYIPHNGTAGAAVINTNRTNFPDSFGPLMQDDSVQAAFEAIDGYINNRLTPDHIRMARLPGSTYFNIQHMQDIFHSSGSSSGGLITDAGGGDVDVSAGTGFIRDTNDSLDTLKYFDWPESLAISVPADDILYIGVSFNDGDPVITTKTTETWNLQTEFPLGLALYEDGYMHIENSSQAVGDHAGNMIRRLVETSRYERDDRLGGLVIGEVGDRYITLSAGAIWTRLNRIAIAAIDTSGSDSVWSYYRDGVGGNTQSTIDQWPNDGYDDDSGTLFPTPTGYYTNLWFWMGVDQHLYMLYGRGAYPTAAGAEAEGRPASDLPLVLEEHALFIGRFIIQEGASVTTSIQTPWEDVIGTSSVTDHGALSGLGEDDHPHYLLADGTRSLTGNWDAAFNITTPEINYIGNLVIDGSTGITLDGNGSDVVPAVDNTDSLGSSSLGWVDIYLQNIAGTSTVGLGDAGTSSTPNTTSGAAVVGTNSDNFISTFGPDMLENSVQSALEAIDGYMAEMGSIIYTLEAGSTLQAAYDNDVDGGDATITTNSDDGAVVIAGTEKFQVTATGGLDLDTGFDMDGAGTFDVDITGAVSIDSDAASDFTVDGATLTLQTTTSGVLYVDGASGIELEGNGADVIPSTSCTDTLGDSTHGWLDLYLCKNGTTPIAIRATGSVNAPNYTSGASVVATNPLNFSTFGPDMSDDTVQSALEAIDGYLQDLNIEDLVNTSFTQVRGLEINGAVLNGVVRVSTDAGTPALDYNQSATSRALWSVPVPADWDGASDFNVEVIWSPEDAGAGDVEWRLEYKALSLTELSSSAATNVDYTQAAAGTADELQSTTTNLAIPGGAVAASDAIIVIGLVRRGAAAGDTYGDDAQVHMVKYSYTAKNIV